MERLVVEAREKLEGSKYAQIGSLAIAFELERLGVQAPPVRTIDHILQRHDLTRKPKAYVSKGKDYPGIDASGPHVIHQLDTVGPRYIAQDGRFYAINVMDVFTGKVAVNPSRRRTHKDVARALLDTWQRLAMPRYVQLDNQLPLRGSQRYPRSFGWVVRMCLHLGIEPVFIPVGEPWRNGVIERFHNVFDKMFFRVQRFASFADLDAEAEGFEQFHNENHRYSTRGGKTPNELERAAGVAPRRLSESFVAPTKLHIEPGQVHLIRFIRSDALLDVFGLRFQMPEDVVYEYVTATIDTGGQRLSVRHDEKTIYEARFPVADTAMRIRW